MQRPKVFVSRRIPQAGLDLLASQAEVQVYDGENAIPRADLEKGLQGCQALLCLLTDRVDAALLKANPQLQIVANYAVGYDNIDLAAATAQKVAVTNTPGVLTDCTADLTWALLLAIARKLVPGDAMTRQGRFKGWGPLLLLGHDVSGKTLGIVGMGRIGQAVARRAQGFGMRVLYTSRSSKDFEGGEACSLERLLREADFVSLHCPLTPQTRHMIGERELGLMKPKAYLINTARGPVVDEAALLKALQSTRLAGAALDVYENEPALTPGLADLDNVVLLPHLGSATVEVREKMSVMAAQNILARLQGQRSPNLLNPEVC